MALDKLLLSRLERWSATFGAPEAGIVADVLLALRQLDDAVRKLEAFVLMPEQREGR